MSNNIADSINKYLQAIYSISSSIYKSFIADNTGVPAETINTPIDYNIGVISDVLQYTEDLYKDLITQLFLNEAVGNFLDLIAHNHIGLVRYDSESDNNYVARIQRFILDAKLSPASIIVAARLFSTAEPNIEEGAIESAFADWSFADNYSSFQNQTAGPTFNYWIFAAIAAGQNNQAFFFILFLTHTTNAQVPHLLDMLDHYVAAGVNYEIRITYP